MTLPFNSIGICLESPPEKLDIATWRAAAETMRASLFLARFTFFTPELQFLATTITRAVSRTMSGEPGPRDSAVPSPGDLLPFPEQVRGEEAELSFRALAHYWSPEAFKQHIKEGKLDESLDIWISLTPPQSELARKLASRATRVVGFRKLSGSHERVRSDVAYLDADWSPNPTVDPESGRLWYEGPIFPPFGLMLQSFCLGLSDRGGKTI